jgi:hypothetical protein
VHLQEVVTGAGGRQLQKVEADAPAPPRRYLERKQEAGGCLIVCLDALACGTCLDELVDGRRQPRRARVLSRPKWPPRGVVCSSVSTVRRSSPAAWMHKRSQRRLLR